MDLMHNQPAGWSLAKLAALNTLIDTAQAYQVVAAVLTAAGDNSAAAQQLKTDLVNLAKTQLATLKSL